MKKTTAWSIAAVLSAAFVAGCAGSVDGTGGAGGTGGSGGGDACSAFVDQQNANHVTVRFRNETGVPVFLQGTCSDIAFSIDNTDGNKGLNYTFGDGACLNTCSDLQHGPPVECGPCQTMAFLLQPGGERDTTWSGTALRQGVVMPLSCYAEPAQSSGKCPQIVAAEPGQYRASALGFSTCEGCSCDANGVCVGPVAGDQALSDPIKFMFPSETLVEVVFGNCAFGCPDG